MKGSITRVTEIFREGGGGAPLSVNFSETKSPLGGGKGGTLVLKNVFVPPPTNFDQKVPPKARNRDKADFATKVRKSSINRVNVNHEQL